ncbi:type II secretion system minor pseudopilin GspK [Endozoicomonas ascidiicola]|uniref:type II secretion system minor pseudopilin GspK n=1 Tax=Endozoicomonas ascidiicola TaxID=1698521 RepID=UPI0008298834|nr:type II secretion system minor pseudopilin GspK [Endozoicomonas ascidiicola]
MMTSLSSCLPDIPIAFQDAALLSAFAHPDHLLFVGSRGFAHLSPSSILKSNGYRKRRKTFVNLTVTSHGSRGYLASKQKQQGLALIYVLLIFSIITVMASKILSTLWLETKAGAHYLEQVQARQYGLGGEQYASLVLEQDFQKDQDSGRQVDFTGEQWSTPVVDESLEEGRIIIVIRDAASGINLNGLTSRKENEEGMKTALSRLLVNHGLDHSLLAKIQDWQDEDQRTRPSGGEDDTYLLNEPPYRTAGSELVSLSELALLEAVTVDDLAAVLPLLSTLPENSALNINTAPDEVLLSLSERMSSTQVDAILDARKEDGISGFSELSAITELAAVLPELKHKRLGYFTRYFQVFIKASYRDADFYLRSLMYRHEDGRTQVVEREMGYNEIWPELEKELGDG